MSTAPHPSSMAQSALAPDLEVHGHWNDLPTEFSRTSQPVRRRSKRNTTKARAPAPPSAAYLPSPALTPYQSDSERVSHDPQPSSAAPRQSSSPSESGAEADDEALRFTHALPAPPVKLRKGLRNGETMDQDRLRATPSPDPKHTREYFEKATIAAHSALLPQTAVKTSATRTAFWDQMRRVVETMLLLAVGMQTISAATSLATPDVWSNGLRSLLWSHGLVLAVFTLLYPLRLLASGRRLRVPASFDPAPLLYPPLVPVMAAVSLVFAFPSACLPNVVLGLSSLPTQLIPHPTRGGGYNPLHWLLSLSPLILAQIGFFDLGAFATTWSPGQVVKPSEVSEELLALLHPMHQCLMQPLKYLTGSSLLPSELQLFSVSLINVLLLAESPQMVIFKYIVWIGAFGLLCLCARVLKWNVAIERIPVWRFRRAGHIAQASRSFLSALAEGLQSEETHLTGAPDRAISAAEPMDNAERRSMPPPSTSQPRADTGLHSADGTAPKFDNDRASQVKAKERRKRAVSSPMHAYLSMTHKQAVLRKVAYPAYTYLVMVILVLGPVRTFVAAKALQGKEPFGWAIAYLLGDVDMVRSAVLHYDLEGWIPLSPNLLHDASSVWVDGLRYDSLGVGNSRLAIFAYFAAVLGLGIGTVLFLSSSVEVDTRRKVFHGTMVALLLPTAFVDPHFISLGLLLVLTAFLLLEVIRAAQLRPFSRPLANFLAPYVDGRDLRGPVVVSHIFLLIGCAIPFWLSLTSIQQSPASKPWKGWEAQSRDVSMVAGVICVGLGDAAASLIGRRFGRHKWPWRGGKSFEGSAAFAVAVAIGLTLSKAWLRYGGWRQTWDDDGIWTTTVTKALIAGLGSSLSEAVLTGCNDNVVVPVLLWLLVRALKV